MKTGRRRSSEGLPVNESRWGKKGERQTRLVLAANTPSILARNGRRRRVRRSQPATWQSHAKTARHRDGESQYGSDVSNAITWALRQTHAPILREHYTACETLPSENRVAFADVGGDVDMGDAMEYRVATRRNGERVQLLIVRRFRRRSKVHASIVAVPLNRILTWSASVKQAVHKCRL